MLAEVVPEEPIVRGGHAGVPGADEGRDGVLRGAAVLVQCVDCLADHLQPNTPTMSRRSKVVIGAPPEK